jgi:hypothetical protein
MYPCAIETCSLCGIETIDAINTRCPECWRAKENSRRARALQVGDEVVVNYLGKRCPGTVAGHNPRGLVVTYCYGEQPHSHGSAVFDGVFPAYRSDNPHLMLNLV